ncbi:MAG: tetratricopeptide repeat protein [Alphaproteobacteria bacterium]
MNAPHLAVAPTPAAALPPPVAAAAADLAGGRLDDALAACEAALAANPDSAEALLLLGLVSFELDEPMQALDLLARAQALAPGTREMADALACVQARLGNRAEGLFWAKYATALTPHPAGDLLLPPRYADFFASLERGDPDLFRRRAARQLAAGNAAAALSLAEKHLTLHPGDAAGLRVLARAATAAARGERAVAAWHAVLHGDVASGDERAADRAGLAAALAAAGRHHEAAAAHDLAIASAPDDPAVTSARIAHRDRHGPADRHAVARLVDDWRQRFAAPLLSRDVAFANRRDPDRPLRVGFLPGADQIDRTADMLAPILDALARHGMTGIVYDEGGGTAAFAAERLARAAERRVDLAGTDDETAWEILRGDAIDIVVDMAGHGAGGRPLLLARRPAPLVVHWFGAGQPAGCGASHLLACPTLWPDGRGEPAAGTQTMRLSRSLSLAPPGGTETAGSGSFAAGGPMVFGMTAPLAALTAESLPALAGLLGAVPGSRLLLADRERADAAAAARVVELLSHAGFGARLDFVAGDDADIDPRAVLAHIDVLVDPAPASAPFLVAEALWAGVPAIALAGDRPTGRRGAAVLAAAGRSDWIAATADDAGAIAAGFAADAGRFARLREDLPGATRASALADVDGFARLLADALRRAWREWCAA